MEKKGGKPSIVVIGVGNTLFSDEGVGVHVVNQLKRMPLPSNVEVVDCGTNGIAVLEALDGAEKAVIVDAVSAGGKPGTIYRLTLSEILAMEDRLLKLVSLHQFDLIAALKLAELTTVYKMPRDIIIVGVEAKSFDLGLGPSEEIKRVIPKVVEVVLREIESHGRESQESTPIDH